MKYSLTLIFILSAVFPAHSQAVEPCCVVQSAETGAVIPGATVQILKSKTAWVADSVGKISPGSGSWDVNKPQRFVVSAVGFETAVVSWQPGQTVFQLEAKADQMDAVVVSGTMRAVSRSASPVPVEVYTPQFLRKNASVTLFDALQLVNGVRPQMNCNVCNTGDIHINGLEGPYTMVLIDGMPIVSSLATVYGLQGIPNSIVERIEVVKGPASSLYGSEAIGGLINVITKAPSKAPQLSVEYTGSSWREHNLDASLRVATGKKSVALVGVNYFNYTHRMDKNNDNFTDVTLQNRLSAFGKLQWQRPCQRSAGMALRFVTEDRWGGEMNWTRKFRGGDEVYGEQISTRRFEWIGNYQLPVAEKMNFSFSATTHQQRSAYGTTLFDADQHIFFTQLTWEKQFNTTHTLLSGIVNRYTYYDDNTPVTTKHNGENQPDQVSIPGIFLQDDITLGNTHSLLAGMRLDYDRRHGSIFTPRFAWKWKLASNDYVRVNMGTGFRVVNLFTEDHAALTGARDVVLLEDLQPERSYNLSLNYSKKLVLGDGYLNLEAAAWYTYFTNRIVPDYETNPNQIIYKNLNGFANSSGASFNIDGRLGSRFTISAGFTAQNVTLTERDEAGQRHRSRQLLTENWSGTWALGYNFGDNRWLIDYSGSVVGPMKLPLLSDLDPRSPNSPVWSLQHLKLTRKWFSGTEIFAGIKNILDFTPNRGNPFLIARAHDPFDKNVVYSPTGAIVPTAENPYALSFDPTYMYAPNQGRRFFIGFRYQLH